MEMEMHSLGDLAYVGDMPHRGIIITGTTDELRSVASLIFREVEVVKAGEVLSLIVRNENLTRSNGRLINLLRRVHAPVDDSLMDEIKVAIEEEGV
jgi:hypothetical protein